MSNPIHYSKTLLKLQRAWQEMVGCSLCQHQYSFRRLKNFVLPWTCKLLPNGCAIDPSTPASGGIALGEMADGSRFSLLKVLQREFGMLLVLKELVVSG